MTSLLGNITGVTTLFGAIVLNIAEMIGDVTINGWFVVATSIGGLFYLYLKIQTQSKESRLKDLEIEEKMLEIEKLKGEQ